MAAIYTTSQLDMLDRICWEFYGSSQGTVEAVLEVNRNLATLLPILPPGVEILLPDLPRPSEGTTLLRFWEPL
ncbi:tail protein X [Cyanobium sp. N5-Cardenillas]|uniref:tail protein X n=1 Tax=Cyanobium sp. N5-Cardenillas TaxID=2823720 RepID=UPI0020CF82C9|nr:tail protein X [Cyanobium sp. N5-Cardenillas]MCP9785395.1 tail protein X [Cyanobium sp. N5-Cardenillas]